MHEHRLIHSLALASLIAAAVAVPARTVAGQAVPSAGDATSAASPDVMQDNVDILVDSSGSMKERMRRGGRSKMEVAKEALSRVLQDVPDTTNVGLLVFGGRNLKDKWLYPLGPIDRAKLDAAIRRPTPNGGTPLGEYLKIAADTLLESASGRQGRCERSGCFHFAGKDLTRGT